jgi:hypothetical protein
LTKAPNLFPNRLHVLGIFSRISIVLYRIIVSELIFSSLPAPTFGKQGRKVISGSIKLLSSLYSITPFIF